MEWTLGLGLAVAAAIAGLAVGSWVSGRRADTHLPGAPLSRSADTVAGGADPAGALARRSVNSLRVGVVVLDADDRPVLMNPAARALGLLRAGADLGSPLAHPIVRTLAGQVRRTGVRREAELDLPRLPEGGAALDDAIGVHLRAVALGGEYVAVEAADVTEAHRVARVRRDFVANVSHELKTPLALIRLFAETLELGRVPSEEKAQQYYRVINKESHRLTQLINNILDFSRIEAGRKEYRFAPTDVARVVREVIESYRFQIEQQGFQLKVEVEEDLPHVPADEEALGQAIINLVNNAIKYSRDSKTIDIEVRRDGSKVLVSVKDTGIGIPRSEQKKIFEKFFRGEDSLVHETKGSGLGLALVRHIMEAHGGSVEVESTPGKGSTFTLALPVAKSGRES